MFHYSRDTIGLAVVAVTVFVAGLGAPRLWDEDEPKNAVCGQEMFERGNWIVPTFNDDLRTDKPILLYWCMIAVYHVLGVSELAARLPSALAGAGSVVLTFHLGKYLFAKRAGLLASCLLASALMFAVLARAATPDSLLILCITASLTSFVAGVAARRGGHFNGTLGRQAGPPTPVHVHGLPSLAYIGMYVAMGFAVLAKGPIGVVMPLGIVGTYLLFCDGVAPAPENVGVIKRFLRYFAPSRIFCVVKTLRLSWGVPLVALVALPWYVAVALKTNGEWVAGFLGTHNVGRFLQPMEHHRGLPIYYVVAILVGFFPASVFLPVAIWQAVGAVRRNDRRSSAAAFLLCWVGCYVGFFTLAATKLPNYVVPCYPALAILAGAWLSAAFDRSTVRDWRLWVGYGSVVAAGICAAIGLAFTAHTLLHTDALPALPALIAILGGVACLALVYQRRVQVSIAAFAVTCLAFTLWATTYTSYRISLLQDGPLLAEQVHNIATSNETANVATYGYFPPSLVYYLGHPVPRLHDAEQIATFFNEGGDALVMPRAVYERERDHLPNNLTVLAETPRFLRKNQQVALIGRKTEVAKAQNREQSR